MLAVTLVPAFGAEGAATTSGTYVCILNLAPLFIAPPECIPSAEIRRDEIILAAAAKGMRVTRPLVAVIIPSRDRPENWSAQRSAAWCGRATMRSRSWSWTTLPRLLWHFRTTSPAIRGYGLVRLEERSGAGAARNAGVRATRGELIAFLDDDDTWRPTKIERQLDVLAERDDLDAVETGYDLWEGERLLVRYVPEVGRDLLDHSPGEAVHAAVDRASAAIGIRGARRLRSDARPRGRIGTSGFVFPSLTMQPRCPRCWSIGRRVGQILPRSSAGPASCCGGSSSRGSRRFPLLIARVPEAPTSLPRRSSALRSVNARRRGGWLSRHGESSRATGDHPLR